MELTKLLDPEIRYRYYLIYIRYPDGRVWFLRQKNRRRKPFLQVPEKSSNWVTDEAYAQLFEMRPDCFDAWCFAKSVKARREEPLFNFRGFSGVVLRTHLIVPDRVRRSPPG